MSESVKIVDAVKAVSGAKQRETTAENKADSKGSRKKASPPPKARGVNADQARRTRSTGPSGEVSYGSPITSDSDRYRNQSTDHHN